MSKEKKLRKIVLDKLYNKNQTHLKKSTRSNAPTQSTPNQPKTLCKIIQKFFENFEAECAIIHQPVAMVNKKPLKRILQQELEEIYKNDMKIKFKTQQNSCLINSNKNLTNQLNKKNVEYKNQRYSRVKTQNNEERFKSQKNLNLNVEEQKDNFLKSKSVFYRQVSSSAIFSKQIPNDFICYQSKQSSPQIKCDKYKVQKLKNSIFIQKQSEKYTSISKNMGAKNSFKYAPKKIIDKQIGYDRIKRIQSLKNLNQNGLRKYSYKRQI